jgi:nicotinate-nucleotide adenylyltransferase
MVGNASAKQRGLDFVLFIPSGDPPVKTGVVWKWRRYVWVRWSCRRNRLLVPCPVEVCRPGKSYTVDTLQQLREMYESWGVQVQFHWIMGMDNVHTIKDWHRAPELLEKCKLLIAPRDNDALTPEAITEALLGLRQGEEWNMISCPDGGVSSSILREAFAGRAYIGCPDYLVSDMVRRDIVECNPYLTAA